MKMATYAVRTGMLASISCLLVNTKSMRRSHLDGLAVSNRHHFIETVPKSLRLEGVDRIVLESIS